MTVLKWILAPFVGGAIAAASIGILASPYLIAAGFGASSNTALFILLMSWVAGPCVAVLLFVIVALGATILRIP